MLGVVVYLFNPSLRWQRQVELCEFQANQRYMVRLYIKNKQKQKPGLRVFNAS